MIKSLLEKNPNHNYGQLKSEYLDSSTPLKNKQEFEPVFWEGFIFDRHQLYLGLEPVLL